MVDADRVARRRGHRRYRAIKVLKCSQPLLFKLRSPHNVLTGGGFFEHYTTLPISFAYGALGEQNGANSPEEVRRHTARLRRNSPRL